jgi:tRNA(Ile)-lysidine synthase
MARRHPFSSKVLHFVQHHQLIQKGDRLLVGVSGGPDSVALLHILHELRHDLDIPPMTVVHFDHRLRGRESLDDRFFVERLAADLGLTCDCSAEDVRAAAYEKHISLEMAARICRHGFFQKVKTLRDAQGIALAHTANDQAEEVLLRLCRGSGPSGLSGMRPREGSGIVRPLLFAAKSEILEYLDSRDLPHCRDSTNEAPCCQRNRVRLEVLPLLGEILHPHVVSCIQRHAQLVLDEEEFWNMTLESWWPAACESEQSDAIHLKCSVLGGFHPSILRRMLRHALRKLQGNLMGIYSDHIELLCDLVYRRKGEKRIDLPGALVTEIRGELLLLKRGNNAQDEPQAEIQPRWIQGPGEWRWPGGGVRIQVVDRQDVLEYRKPHAPAVPPRACLDADRVRWPLCLRGWRPGDRFQPLGLSGSKKLQDFFVDLKVAREKRRTILIVADREKICWVVDYRLDDRLKITSQTRRVLILELIEDGSLE